MARKSCDQHFHPVTETCNDIASYPLSHVARELVQTAICAIQYPITAKHASRPINSSANSAHRPSMKQISHSGRRINGDKPLLSGQIVHQTFTIQSISKAFVFGLALEDNGIDAMESMPWKPGWTSNPRARPSTPSACAPTQADRSIQ
jgi:hypothetical protein